MSDEQYVVEFSNDQNCFHIDPLQVVIKHNMAAFRDGQRISYVPIFTGTQQECVDRCTTLQKRRTNRMLETLDQ